MNDVRGTKLANHKLRSPLCLYIAPRLVIDANEFVYGILRVLEDRGWRAIYVADGNSLTAGTCRNFFLQPVVVHQKQSLFQGGRQWAQKVKLDAICAAMVTTRLAPLNGDVRAIFQESSLKVECWGISGLHYFCNENFSIWPLGKDI